MTRAMYILGNRFEAAILGSLPVTPPPFHILPRTPPGPHLIVGEFFFLLKFISIIREDVIMEEDYKTLL